jgi:N4-gp56 family major capsid protein
MAISLNWTVDADGGYMYEDELSDVLRTALQPLTKFRQFCEPDEDALNKGLHRSQSSLTVVEMGNSVPYTGKLTALAKHDVLRIINKALKNDARKAFDIEAWTQFNACKLRAAPTSGTSTTSVTITENASTATTNNVALGTGHVKAIVDEMRERNVPGFAEDDYVAISHPTTLRPFKNELESIRQYTNEGLTKVYNGEIGRYEGTRFVEQDFVPKGGAIDSTTFDPYTRTADAWNNAKSSWAFFFGADTVNEAVVIPEEIRAKLPGDFGRSGGIAWYYLGGFGIFHDTAAQSRIMKWDSAA